MVKGTFITFEGPEGSGKSTQASLLANELRQRGYQVVITREPGGTMVGEAIRSVLLNKEFKITAIAELLLYAAARSQIIEDIIAPALQEGNIVICDRFVDSSMAYQGFARGLGFALVTKINDLVLDGIKPDLTFLLDIESEEGLARASIKGLDRLEQEDISFHRKVREGYLELSKKNDHYLVYDATEEIYSIHDKVLQDTLTFLGKNSPSL